MRSVVLMEASSLLSLPTGLRVERIERQGDLLVVAVVSVSPSSCCPLCAQASVQVHSQYQRTLRDVPCGGRQVMLHLGVRKFFCRTPDCARKIFTERLPAFVQPWAQVTIRLFEAVQVVGLATGGELGTRLADHIGMHTSPTTTLRRIMALPPCVPQPVRVLGIDDWSFRRGRTFGTLLVDLTSRKTLDLLPDRTAETAAAWMSKHPEIEVVSRDRGGEYASAATTGAPQAVQCADRFHMLKNLGEAVEGCLIRHLAVQRKTQRQEPLEEHPPLGEVPRSARRSPKVERRQQAYREERLTRYEQVVALHQRGMSQAAMLQHVGIGHSTVSLWLAAGAYPETTRGPYVSRIDPYLPYLFERWESGCHNMVRLHQELVARGYKGSYASVRDHLVRRLPEGKKNGAKGAKLSPALLPSRQATFMFLRRPEDLDQKEQGTLLQLRQSHPEMELAYDLVQQFAKMLRTRTGEDLDAWLAKALASQIPEFGSFVQGVERDKAAVKAGLTLPHSNGIVEGKVNKLKLIKRMGFGRAGFPLLRQRVLHAR
jgi:transposase